MSETNEEKLSKNIKIEYPGENDYIVNESLKSIRTNIQFCGSNIKVIAMTSCFENEGKSTLSILLAKQFIEIGKKVLVIDGDLRKSVFVQRFVKSNNTIYGMSEYLSGQKSIEEVTYIAEDGLNMIFAGHLAPNPSELLSSDNFDCLLKESKEKYDIIIIDTPPLGIVIDAAIVASKSDGSILIFKEKSVRVKTATQIKSQLQKSGCRILGCILNNVDIGEGKYGYRKYKKYQKKYGAYEFKG